MNKVFFTLLVGQALNSGLESRVRFKIPEDENKKPGTSAHSQPKVAKLSFEDYHITWSGIATSKARHDLKNPCMKMFTFYKICSLNYVYSLYSQKNS